MSSASTTSNPHKRFDSSEYPEPLVMPPTLEHKHTIIILHGRGSSAERFGPALLEAEIPEFTNLATAFPHAKFVFPTASKRRATMYKRIYINQWFDSWDLSSPNEREELQIEGLRESSAFIHGLLRRETELVGGRNVVLGGLSQGCAASLVGLLMWDGEPLAAAVGMCGWLPYRAHMEDIVRNIGAGDDGDDLFIRLDEAGEGLSNESEHAEPTPDLPTQAISFLREELEMAPPAQLLPPRSTALFLGHGVEDERVSVQLGRGASSCLSALGVDVHWREYEGLGHWYSREMLRDLVEFLRERTGWEVAVDTAMVTSES
ncbi:hypothetical protein FGG08_004954 [Glutinoglossum americanum]|uniref:Phospholipase/carboxylesterase/thioesterase domain-containing protein n=1 Tax=Glutinoglossum americanum TaxID=1670608 RepID=A0A9P8L1X9_9PEZI|nr:hypothetical protein FGG08_004954 [Glutinoglossum americanum]